jgi:hypothetical protein
MSLEKLPLEVLGSLYSELNVTGLSQYRYQFTSGSNMVIITGMQSYILSNIRQGTSLVERIGSTEIRPSKEIRGSGLEVYLSSAGMDGKAYSRDI